MMRLLASNHWFADGNKRTALNTTELFYLVNGYELDYGEDIRSMLKLFSVRETLIDQEAGPEYLKDQTSIVETDGDGELWSAILGLVAVALAEYLDPDLEETIPEDADWNVQEELGLTTFGDGMVNNEDDEANTNDGR
jgi:death-on-curing protein